MPSAFDVDGCRRQFPALAREHAGKPAVFFDGPAGSQTPRGVIDAVAGYLANTNANHEGVFATSVESDQILAEAHRAVADLLGADDPETILFGANMTTITLALSRAMAAAWGPGDEVVVSRSDHDANVTPWVLAARDAGAAVRHVAIHTEDGTLDMDDLRGKLNGRTRLVAVGAASNGTGTVHPVREICQAAHRHGAEVFVDAVHYAPHRLIDVAAWGCDYLAASAYKFFGPHVGMLWGRRDRLEEITPYKLRPATDNLPGRWMTGTQCHEGIAGTLAAVEYFAELGRHNQPSAANRREAIRAAFEAIGEYETALARLLLAGLAGIDEIRVWGITDATRLAERVATFCFTHARQAPLEIARRLADQGIFVWHGNYYALPLTEALGLEPDGAVRVGLLHYNTADEVDRLLTALRAL